MSKTHEWIARNKLIRVMEKQAGIDQDGHKQILMQVLRKPSLKDCTIKEMDAVVAHLQKRVKLNPTKQMRPASKKPYIRMVWGLGKEYADLGGWDNPDYKAAIRAFAKRMTDIDHPDWLNYKQAEIIIEALKDMIARKKSEANG